MMFQITCLDCNHPVSATTLVEQQQGMQAHVDWVNTQSRTQGAICREKDVHFQDGRLDDLIADKGARH